jgi:hypothetical protein
MTNPIQLEDHPTPWGQVENETRVAMELPDGHMIVGRKVWFDLFVPDDREHERIRLSPECPVYQEQKAFTVEVKKI